MDVRDRTLLDLKSAYHFLSGFPRALRTPYRDQRRQEPLRANHSESAASRSWLSLSPSF